MKISVIFYLLLLLSSLNLNAQFSQYVDPFIGTDGTGHTFPGAVLPFGMVQLSPDTRNDATWEGASGYHYSDSVIYGFSHTHLSGTGVSDWGDILIAPQTGNPSIQPNEYAQTFSHENEKASAGFYQVFLDNGVDVSLTCSERVGFHRYIFPKEQQKHLLIDLQHRDEVLSSHIKITSSNTIEGSRISKGWAEKQVVYFNIEFSEDFEHEIFLEDSSMKGQIQKDNYYGGKNVKSLLTFKSDTVKMKVAISFVSNEGAKKNLSEINHFNFEKAKTKAQSIWEQQLSRIEISTPFEELKTIFYTALYHSMLHPTLASDIDGKYRGLDQKIYQDTARPHYTVFSLWDTFRASHPLFNLLIPSKNEDFIHSMLRMYDHSGRLPVWELSANETECMIGYHSVSVIADAFAKGKRNFEIEKALSAMISSAETDLFGLPYYREKGFIEATDEHESVSKTLEYAYDDWCIARMAEKLGKEEIADEFYFRSKAWRHLFDKESGFIRPRKNGGWEVPFSPENVNLNYTEANAWQYNFFVPHDIQGLINAYGGKREFEKKLDEFFNTSSQTSGLNHPDITGLIGQYAHGNEPSHHYAYLYNYVDKPWKSQKIIRQILNEFYTTKPDGLIGNDDCGQMSAWYVFSSLGFYPTLPGTPYYDLGSPLFEKATIQLENGNELIINAVNAGPKYPYHLNEHKYVLDHYILERGGQFTYTMTDQPMNKLSNNAVTPFHSSVKSHNFIPAPVILRAKEIFKDSAWVKIEKTSEKGILYYQVNQEPKKKYESPFLIDTNVQISAWVEKGDFKSPEVKAKYYKIPNNWEIELAQEHHNLYNAGGKIGLIDGLFGDDNWKKGRWQGYQNTDFTATIDLKERMRIDSVGASFLQDTRSWIMMPKEIIIETCRKKGKSFKEAARLSLTTPPDDYNTTLEKVFTDQIKGKIRYVRFTAKNFGSLPEWHQGYPYDGKAFIFVDELMVFPKK